MATIPQRVSYIYNPQNQSKEELIDAFVVRLQMFQKLWKEIKEVKMEHPEQHYLILGKRGQGKTTLLLRLAYEIENDAELNTWMIPIVFNEEEYSIRKLYKFWLRIMQLLEEQNEDFEGLYQKAENLSAKYPSDEEYERALADLLLQSLKSKEKKVILFIDNFGDMFNKFKEQEAHRLRKILNTVAEIRIFGASSKALEVSYDYKHPFYEFFKTERLSGLNKNETTELLLKLGEEYKQEQVKEIVENQKGRIEALRRISNGVIRTIVLLFEIFVDDQNGNAFSDLEGILDRVTPLYKHRMDDLSAQQQEIVEVIALNWDAVSVKEIAEQTRMESKKVSAQLTQLLKNEIIQKIPTTTKNHLYQLEERFFNIWYLMRHGRRGDSRRVLWLVRFFEEWCDEEQLVKRVEKHIEYLKNGDYNTKAAYFITEALANTRHISNRLQHNLLRVSKSFLNSCSSDLAIQLSESDTNLHAKASKLLKDKKYHEAVIILNTMKKPCYNCFEKAYKGKKDFNNAELYFKKAIEEKGSFSGALKSLFNILVEQEKFEELETYLNSLPFESAKHQFLAKLYDKQKKYSMAISSYKMAIKLSGDTNEKRWLIHRLAHSYGFLKDFKNAIKYFNEAIALGDIQACNCLGDLHYRNKDYDKAQMAYLHAFEKGNLNAALYLGGIFKIKKDYDNAEKYFLKAVEKSNTEAMIGLGVLYLEQKKHAKAEKYFLKAIERKNYNAANNLGWLYFEQKTNKEAALKYATIAFQKTNNQLEISHTLSIIQLWYNLYIESWQTAQSFIYDVELVENNYSEFILYFQLLLAKEQYQTLYDYFNSEKAQELHIKDRFKPIWYALMYYMQDQYPNEYLKMGGELKETVEEIIAEVEQMRVDYA